MTVHVSTYDGAVWQLPVLSGFQVDSGDWDSCAGFTASFPWDGRELPALEKAMEFTAMEAGKVVACGIVDEVEIRMSSRGLVAELSGRSMAAKLLDNQVPGAEFALLQMEEVLRRYVRPFGITKIQADPLPAISNVLVETGSNCYQILTTFCRHSAGILPRFLADGTLVLKKEPDYDRLVITEAAAPKKINYRVCRYGRIARQITVGSRMGQQEVAENPEFYTQGGRTQKVVREPGRLLHSDWRSAQQRIRDADREKLVLEMSLPGGFLANPGDQAQITLRTMGISGSFWVRSVRTTLDEEGLLCTLELGKERT